jgi:hypothetical protein
MRTATKCIGLHGGNFDTQRMKRAWDFEISRALI